MQKLEFTAPLETPNDIFIFQVREKRDSYAPEFEEVIEKVRAAVIDQKALEISEKNAQTSAQQIQEKYEASNLKDFAQIAKTLGLDIYQTPLFTRGQYLPQIGISKEFQEAAFALDDQDKISDVVKLANGFAILHRDKYEPAGEENFDKQKASIREGLLNEQRNKLFGDYLSNLRIKANLEDNIERQRNQSS